MSQMKNVYRRYALAGATFSIAISIGFLMQSSEASQAAVATVSAVSTSPSQVEKASLPGALSTPRKSVAKVLPSLPKDRAAPRSLPETPTVLLVSRDAPIGLLPEEEPAPALGCENELTATASAAAMVDLQLSAPCQPGVRVTVHHEDLKFTEITGPDGSLQITVPAFAENAMFAVTFPNGDGAVASVRVDSLPFYDRAAIQWKGQGALELHAFEFGAPYGGVGHVWSGAPRDLTAVNGGLGGFLVHLGNSEAAEPLMAEVYTFPTLIASQAGSVALNVEAQVSMTNCGRRLALQSIEVHDGRVTDIHDLTLELPDCDAAGEFLVLKNLLQDLTIAQN